MDLISVQGVSKRYTKGSETIQVLDDVSFQIRAGEMVSVIGASGAGKSTLLHVLGTLDAPDQGDILYQGRSLVSLDSYFDNFLSICMRRNGQTQASY